MKPIHLKLLQKTRQLEIEFTGGLKANLSTHFLRVHSPSAEQKSVIPEQVNIVAIEPVGHYAVRLIFDDGHSTGIYSWELLYKLASSVMPA